MSFSCPFLDPHLTTFHSNIGVQVIAMLDLGTSTLRVQRFWALNEMVLGRRYWLGLRIGLNMLQGRKE